MTSLGHNPLCPQCKHPMDAHTSVFEPVGCMIPGCDCSYTPEDFDRDLRLKREPNRSLPEQFTLTGEGPWQLWYTRVRGLGQPLVQERIGSLYWNKQEAINAAHEYLTIWREEHEDR